MTDKELIDIFNQLDPIEKDRIYQQAVSEIEDDEYRKLLQSLPKVLAND